MDVIRWIRDSHARTSLVIAALYGTATPGAALLLRRSLVTASLVLALGSTLVAVVLVAGAWVAQGLS